jgi:Restriction Enzyme Adenine Methylase Associated/Type I restriction enzyme R protein N terminus (HSDR_N)
VTATDDISALGNALAEIADRVARYRGERIGEQSTKAALIVPVLRALGWNVEDLDEVQFEYRTVRGDNPVDFALLLQRRPVLFIEAKALGENLRDRKWASQIVSYAAVAGVEWVVLTNGDEYWIYNALSKHDVEDKLFRAVSLSEDRPQAEEALRLLTKEELRNQSLGALWRAQMIDNRVRSAVEALFEPEPSPWLVRRIAKAAELTAGDVKAALSRARVTLDLPPAESVSGTPDTGVKQPSRPPRKRKAVRPETGSFDVTLKDLLNAGLLRPGLELRKTYLGTEVVATVETDGQVRVGSQIVRSLSVAGGIARVEVKGPPADGRPYYQTNGWTFWEYEDDSGHRHAIDKIRQQYLAARTEARG